jgi:hypothetical protein
LAGRGPLRPASALDATRQAAMTTIVTASHNTGAPTMTSCVSIARILAPLAEAPL